MELLANALRSPDDPRPWQVLGDRLLADGHPRGTLIALQTRNGPDEPTRRHLWDHRQTLLPRLWDRVDPWTVRWQYGYLRELALVVDAWTTRTAETLDALAADDGLIALQRLRLCSSSRFDNAMDAVVRHRWPLLEELVMGPMIVGAGRMAAPLRPLLDALPALRSLRLELPDDLSDLRHPTLERLVLHALPEQLPGLDLDGLPRLTHLTLYSRTPVTAGQLDGLRGRAFTSLTLHPHVAPGWFARPAEPPGTLFLYDRQQAHWNAAEARGISVRRSREPRADHDPLLTPRTDRAWRRFLKGGRFWDIRRTKDTVKFRFGKVGQKGTMRTKAHRSPYDASRDVRERIGKKRKEGYIEGWLTDADRYTS